MVESSSRFHVPRSAFYRHFIVPPYHENSSSRRFSKNLHMRTSSIKFFHVSFRSLLRRMQCRVVANALYLLMDRTAIIEFQRLKFNGKIVVQIKENNTADICRSRVTLLIAGTYQAENYKRVSVRVLPHRYRFGCEFYLSFHFSRSM